MTKPAKAASSLLPEEARLLLQHAATTPITNADPNARNKAIDHAAGYIRSKWPQYFKPVLPCA